MMTETRINVFFSEISVLFSFLLFGGSLHSFLIFFICGQSISFCLNYARGRRRESLVLLFENQKKTREA